MQGQAFEREVVRELPAILSDLLDEELGPASVVREDDGSSDIVVVAGGRRWAFQLKTSSSPGIVAEAGLQRHRWAPDAIAVLVVPYMSQAGARAAAEAELNWIDLSGNARLHEDRLLVRVEGRPNRFPPRGRPSSPFAPKSSRVAHVMLLDPDKRWRQKDLAAETELDDSVVSRVVRRLVDEQLIARQQRDYRVVDALRLLDAWADDYRFDRHDIVVGHITGSGFDGTRELHERLTAAGVRHAFTGLASAWAIDPFATFRLNTVYVDGDPRAVADAIRIRRNERGANVQLIGPDDKGVYLGEYEQAGLPLVSPVQTYLDLQHLPERAAEAATSIRDGGWLWKRIKD